MSRLGSQVASLKARLHQAQVDADNAASNAQAAQAESHSTSSQPSKAESAKLRALEAQMEDKDAEIEECWRRVSEAEAKARNIRKKVLVSH